MSGSASVVRRVSFVERITTGGVAERLRTVFAPALLVLLLPIAALLVKAPLLALGLVLGSALLVAVLMYPLAVIGLMLFIGPIDLSWVTGGFKGLFASIGGLDMNGIRLIGVTAGLGFTALILPQARRVLFGRYGMLYTAFLAWALLTLPLSMLPVDGLRLWFKLAYPLLFFGLIIGFARDRRDVDRLMDYTLIGAALVVVLSLFLTASGNFGTYADHTRARGVALHENPFSFYLLIGLYMSFARFAVRGQWRYLLLAAAMGGWLVMTLTRITFLAAAVGLSGIALYAAIAARDRRMLLGAIGLGTLIAVPLLPAVMARSFGYVPSFGELIALVQSPMGLYEAINWQGREIVWPIIFGAFLGQPITGLGLGSSTALMMLYFPAEAGMVVHNEYLRLASETGAIGFVLFSCAILAWLVGVMIVDRRTGGRAREFTMPAMAGIISWSILSITDNVFDYYASYTQYIGLLVAAAFVVAADLGRHAAQPGKQTDDAEREAGRALRA